MSTKRIHPFECISRLRFGVIFYVIEAQKEYINYIHIPVIKYKKNLIFNKYFDNILCQKKKHKKNIFFYMLIICLMKDFVIIHKKIFFRNIFQNYFYIKYSYK